MISSQLTQHSHSFRWIVKLWQNQTYIVWRFLTAPLATSSLFDVVLVMTFYLVKTMGPKEHLKGTALAMVEFFVKGKQIWNQSFTF